MRSLNNLSHTPIICVNYESIDSSAGAGDAKYLSLGRATWAKGGEDYSAKAFRLSNEGQENERWSRQSEELPFWRVLDLATLLIAAIFHKESNLNEKKVGNQNEIDDLKAFLNKNYKTYVPRIMELKRLLAEE